MLKYKIWLLLLCVQSSLYAQDSIRALQDERVINAYGLSGNPALMTKLVLYGFVAAEGSYTDGDLKRPMEPASFQALSLATGGFRKISGWTYKGYFRYQKKYDKALPYSDVYDAYEGNPFIWADSSTGHWERDHITASVGIATPLLLKKIHAGLEVNYSIGTGAKENEPKPFYRVRYITLQPGISWQLTDKQVAGLTGSVEFIKEDNEIGYYSNRNVILHRLYGYAYSGRTNFISGIRTRTGTSVNGSAYYERNWGKHRLVASIYGGQREEDVYEGIAIQLMQGYYTAITLGGKVTWYTGDAFNGSLIQLSFEQREDFSDAVPFGAESASSFQQSLSAKLSKWYQAGKNGWQWSIIPGYFMRDLLDYATVAQINTTTIGADIQLNWRRSLTEKWHLQLLPSIGYYAVPGDHFSYQSDHIMIRQLFIPDHQFLSASYWKASMMAGIAYTNKRTHTLNVYANGRYATFQRTAFQLQYSMLF